MSRKAHSQSEHFTIRGHWWLPITNQRIAGDLRYTEGDLTLSLYEGLNEAHVESPFSATPTSTEFPVILGETLEAVPVTVLRSFYTKWTPDVRTLAVRPGTTTAIRSAELHCGWLLEGVHLSSPDETFAKCRVEIPYLEDWLGESPFRAEMGGEGETVRLDYTRPTNISIEISATSSALRLIHAVRPPGHPLGTSPTIEHHTYMEIAPAEPKPINWFVSQASEIVGLLAVCYGGSLLSRRLTLYKDGPSRAGALLYYPRHTAEVGPYTAMDFVVRYQQIETGFRQIVENWLGATEAVKGARSILLSSERRPSEFIELRFLPLVHAAEVLSGEGPNAAIVPKDTYRDVRDRMLASLPAGLPGELIESIRNSLGHANSRTLRRKLLGLLSELGDDTWRLFCTDREVFIKGVVDTRNHYTHYSTGQDRKILQGADLHWAIQKLSLMLRVVLLVKAGVPEDTLRSAIRSHHRLRQERHVWQTMNEGGSVLSGVDGE
ncbi:MAG TPA: HEPN domain-containing protein [Fimbriiglobus sp.]|nr:HEPN domain-containing protein [Fimbriiglobus sp.]